MNLFERIFLGLDGKHIFRTVGCFWVVGAFFTLGFWGLVILALVKYIKS